MSNWQTRKGRVDMSSYRSGLEATTAESLTERGIEFRFEPNEGKIPWTQPAKDRTYTPDFYIKTRSGKEIIIETKGLWDAKDREKHRLIRQQHPEHDIRFVFSRSASKIRKGSKTTYADICEGRGRGPFKGIVWQYADRVIPEEWLNE